MDQAQFHRIGSAIGLETESCSERARCRSEVTTVLALLRLAAHRETQASCSSALYGALHHLRFCWDEVTDIE
jgi:hypothetical protein